MANVNQDTRHIGIGTPLGENELLLRGFSAHEGMSNIFEIELDLLSENYEIEFNDIIGKNVTLRMNFPDEGERYWNGYINRFVQGRSTSSQFAQYRATMVPWMWFLTLTSDCRIFQDMTVPDIVAQIINDNGFSDIEDRLSGGYREWKYCVQYRETDFNFISRLMEQEGIYYYWKHEDGKHTVVLCDSSSKHDAYENYDTIEYRGETRASSQQEVITEWTVNKSVQPGGFAHTDYNFEKPDTSLFNNSEDPKPHDKADFEIYDFPGEYPETADGSRYADIRMQELAHPHETCSGQSDSRGVVTGYNFTLDRHTRADQNREYLIRSTEYHASAQDYETAAGGGEALCACSFTAIPGEVQFRPPRTTPKPSINGTQTAIVTGPSGEEIWTDEYGRIKVQFHWDREGQKDENSSCWVRVRQNWAGNQWGGIHIPRIGQEVIVDFIEGDPDQPIVLGAVYHAQNMPPYELPAEATKSTIKSDSSLGHGGFNEIRMEDKKGEEQLFLHAEKNQDVRTKERFSEWVGKSRHQIVKNNEKEYVGAEKHVYVDKRTFEYVEEDKHIHIHGAHNEKVDATMSITVGGDKLEKIGPKWASDVQQEIHLKSGIKVVLEAGVEITIKAGGSFIKCDPSGVTINGAMVKINSGGSAGSGSGSSPEIPEDAGKPHEADSDDSGDSAAGRSGGPASPASRTASTLAPAPVSSSPQEQNMQSASDSGRPFCAECEAARQAQAEQGGGGTTSAASGSSGGTTAASSGNGGGTGSHVFAGPLVGRGGADDDVDFEPDDEPDDVHDSDADY